MLKIRPMRPGAGEYQGLGHLATGCRGAVDSLRVKPRCLSRVVPEFVVDFFAVNRHIGWGGDAESYLMAANAQHLNADVVVYADGFAYLPVSNSRMLRRSLCRRRGAVLLAPTACSL